jgi:hypothetical protein
VYGGIFYQRQWNRLSSTGIVVASIQHYCRCHLVARRKHLDGRLAQPPSMDPPSATSTLTHLLPSSPNFVSPQLHQVSISPTPSTALRLTSRLFLNRFGSATSASTCLLSPPSHSPRSWPRHPSLLLLLLLSLINFFIRTLSTLLPQSPLLANPPPSIMPSPSNLRRHRSQTSVPTPSALRCRRSSPTPHRRSLDFAPLSAHQTSSPLYRLCATTTAHQLPSQLPRLCVPRRCSPTLMHTPSTLRCRLCRSTTPPRPRLCAAVYAALQTPIPAPPTLPRRLPTSLPRLCAPAARQPHSLDFAPPSMPLALLSSPLYRLCPAVSSDRLTPLPNPPTPIPSTLRCPRRRSPTTIPTLSILRHHRSLLTATASPFPPSTSHRHPYHQDRIKSPSLNFAPATIATAVASTPPPHPHRFNVAPPPPPPPPQPHISLTSV